MTSGGSRRRECPASAKKPMRSPTGAVCRSCTILPVSIRAPPPGGETGTVFPVLSTRRRHLAGRVPRAKRLGRRRRNPGPRNLHTAYIIYLMEPGTATGRQWRRASGPERGRGIRALRKKGRRNPGRCREPVQRRAAFRLSDRATARTA